MGRKKEYDSEDLVETCTNIFWTRGFNGTSVGDLVKESGVSRSSLYKEFDGKDGLYFSVVKSYSEQNLHRFREVMASDMPFESKITLFFSFTPESDCAKGCFIVNAISEIDAIPKDVQEYVKQHVSELRSAFVEALECAKKSGEIDSQLDVDFAADTLLVMLNGLQIMKRTGGAASYEESMKKAVHCLLFCT